MKRPIVGYHHDELGDLVAELSCGHGQHVRHKPPFTLRPWTLTQEGRDAMLGTELSCLRCDRRELPEGALAYKRTETFDETSVPKGLLREHTTKASVWGVIVVLSGSLRYVIEGEGGDETTLDPRAPGIVVPELPHHVALLGPVTFFVEFRRVPARLG